MTPERWQKVKEICYSVLDRGQKERSELLNELCAGDDDLRRDVEVMMADATGEDSTRERPAWHLAGIWGRTIGLGGLEGTRARWIPDVIGSYRILRVVGEGGMGVVYEAQQHEPHRTVALKVIKPGLASPEILRRFRQETHALGRLQHPGIAQIYEAGTADTPFGPQPYFAMEFIRGESLRSYIDKHHLKVPQRLELMARICDGVHHAHQRGLIHRDLKPSNILIDDSGQPKILDFGVARLTDSDVQMTTQHTDLGQLIGTLAYMSPEQVLADPLEVDTRSDVYALGVILYELLAGRLPYTVSARVHEAVKTIQQEDPKRLSSISRIYRGDLETIAAKALEKDKTRRYGSAAALAADIRRHLQNEPISARPASTTYQLQKFARRHRALVTGVVAVFVVLTAGIVATSREAIRARQAEQAAIAAEQTAQAVNDFLQNDLLSQAGASAQASPDQRPDPDLKVRVALDRAASRIEGKFKGQPAVEASIRATIGKTYHDLALYPEAQQQLERALELRRRERGNDHPDTVRSIVDLAALFSDAGKWAQAESVANEAIALSNRVRGEQHPESVEAAGVLAQIFSDQGKFAQAEPLLAKILDVQRRTLGDRSADTLTSMNNLALCYRRLRKDPQAEQLYTEALGLRRTVTGEDHPDTLLVMNNLAGLYLAQGRYAESESVFIKLLELSRRALGGEHRITLLGMNGLSLTYANLGKLAQAESLSGSLLDVQRRVMGETHPATLASMNNLGLVQWRQGRFADAESIQVKLLETRRRELGEEHPDTLASMQNLARVFRSQGRFDEADPLLAKVVSARQRLLGAESPVTLSALNDLGALYGARGDYGKAETVLTRTLEALRRVSGKEGAQTLTALENLAEADRLQGRFAEAGASLTALLEARRRTAGEDSPLTTSALVALGRLWVQQRKFREAETLLRAALENYEKTAPDSWRRFQCSTLLGASLAGLGEYEDAEALLVNGYQGMLQRQTTIPAEDRSSLEWTRQSLVQLYQAWRKPGKAAEWSRKLSGA